MKSKPIEYKPHELKALCKRGGAERLALFGFALRNDLDPEKSNLDFFVEFSPMSPEEYAAAYFGLLEYLRYL
jgi:predicted nucleotidyltransferase